MRLEFATEFLLNPERILGGVEGQGSQSITRDVLHNFAVVVSGTPPQGKAGKELAGYSLRPHNDGVPNCESTGTASDSMRDRFRTRQLTRLEGAHDRHRIPFPSSESEASALYAFGDGCPRRLFLPLHTAVSKVSRNGYRVARRSGDHCTHTHLSRIDKLDPQSACIPSPTAV